MSSMTKEEMLVMISRAVNESVIGAKEITIDDCISYTVAYIQSHTGYQNVKLKNARLEDGLFMFDGFELSFGITEISVDNAGRP